MGTESVHAYPQSFIFWYLRGDDLALVTNDSDLDSITDMDTGSIYVSNKESIIQGLMIEYDGEMQLLDPEVSDIHNQEPNINPRLHPILLDYIKAKLYEEVGTEIALAMARGHMRAFQRKMNMLNGGRPKASVYKTYPNRATSVL